jgi:hypothetical protein
MGAPYIYDISSLKVNLTDFNGIELIDIKASPMEVSDTLSTGKYRADTRVK